MKTRYHRSLKAPERHLLSISWTVLWRITLSAFLATTLLALRSHAQTTINCNILLEALKISDLKTNINPHEFTELIHTVGQLPGNHDGHLLVIETEKPGYWYTTFDAVRDKYSQKLLAPLGDPRGIALAIGAPIADFFGFKTINDTRITMPDPNEFQGALNKLNRWLLAHGKKAFAVSFYAVSGTEKTSDLIYLQRWARSGELPLAKDGAFALHDIGYHALDFLLPHDVAFHSRLQAQRALEFINFARTQIERRTEYKELTNFGFVELYLNQVSHRVDLGTGNFMSKVLTRSLRGQVEKYHEDTWLYGMGELLEYFTGNGMSPDDFLLDSANKMRPGYDYYKAGAYEKAAQLIEEFKVLSPSPTASQRLVLVGSGLSRPDSIIQTGKKLHQDYQEQLKLLARAYAGVRRGL